MLQKIRNYVAAAALAGVPLLSLLMPGIAHAATITWTGGGTDGNWSTTANWQGGVVPGNGDTVVIDNSANFSHGLTDDIAGLSLAGITFTNNDGSGVRYIVLAQNLTVTGSIQQASSVTNTANGVDSDSSARTLTLGGNVTMSGMKSLTLGGSGTHLTVALGSNTLTWAETAGTTGYQGVSYAVISGTGSVVYNGSKSQFQIGGANTYSGTTQVTATNTAGVFKVGLNNNNPFGTSAVTIGSAGNVGLDGFTASTTLSNAFTITGDPVNHTLTSMSFGSSLNSGAITLTVPNITLNGNTRFANDGTTNDPLTVDLAGITANGFCIQYLGNGTNAGFVNGPDACVVGQDANVASTTDDPQAPDTGFALAAAHPVVTLVATTASALAIFAISRSLRKGSARR